jgi:sterol desaturase/sphingolipid hydroxylase (fatty acid hydroxylase superfamily)
MPWIAYPGTLLLGLSIHVGLSGLGQPPLISTYTPVLIGALLGTLLELRLPNETQWKPDPYEVGQDALYMEFVQMLWPKMLAFAVALGALGAVGEEHAPLLNWWPHQLPTGVQAVVMVLGADFLRYWLHRTSHKTPWLWRLHAVHHSPKRLYWLNVGRFHPLDKALQFLLDTLPFILLGVSETVVALYFVFYAINGFFQHSNIKLRYGWLNHVISSAELHRWHHSRIPEESNTNFGNNIIIWDLLFGTRFLPDERTVGELGLKNQHYPQRFIDQLAAPFIEGITDHDVPMNTLTRRARGLALRCRMQWIRLFTWMPFIRATKDPIATQESLLDSIIQKGLDTRFGKEHGFEEINSYHDFVDRVPVHDYEALRPYIEAQEAGEGAALTAESPVMYTVTSGTTGEPKYIPVLDTTIRQYKEGQQLFSLMLYQSCPEAFEGKAFAVASPAVEGYRPSDVPYGSVSGHLYASMPRLIRAHYVIPPEVNAIADHALKYRVMLRLALAEPNITYLAGANPSSFLQLLSVLNDSRDELAESLELGGMRGLGELRCRRR